MLVKDLIGKRSKIGDVGIEVEVEAGAVLPDIETKPWSTKTDGSLRGGVAGGAKEYYTQGPIPVNDQKLSRIKRLTDELDVKKYKIFEDTNRTSVHVHVNCLELRPTQVWTAACAYWLFEDAFMSYCGDIRKGCMYCLRLRDAEAVVHTAINNIEADIPIFGLAGADRIRYCSQNLMALGQFGTLEYRGMRGTLDPNVIDTWSTMVYNIVNKSAVFRTPSELMDYYWRNGGPAVLRQLTTEEHYGILTKGEPKWEELAEENATNLFELAYAVDWDVWEASRKERFNKISATKSGPQARAAIGAAIRAGRVRAPVRIFD